MRERLEIMERTLLIEIKSLPPVVEGQSLLREKRRRHTSGIYQRRQRMIPTIISMML